MDIYDPSQSALHSYQPCQAASKQYRRAVLCVCLLFILLLGILLFLRTWPRAPWWHQRTRIFWGGMIVLFAFLADTGRYQYMVMTCPRAWHDMQFIVYRNLCGSGMAGIRTRQLLLLAQINAWEGEYAAAGSALSHVQAELLKPGKRALWERLRAFVDRKLREERVDVKEASGLFREIERHLLLSRIGYMAASLLLILSVARLVFLA